MAAFMYYIRRIDLLAAHINRMPYEFAEHAVEELREDIQRAEIQMHISTYQADKLLMKLDKTF